MLLSYRPALCLDRPSIDAAGQIEYLLKSPHRDGTTHVLFSRQDFVARLAALVPRPRTNLTRYHGVFAPTSPTRHAIAATPGDQPRRRKPKDFATPQATRQQQPADPPPDSSARAEPHAILLDPFADR